MGNFKPRPARAVEIELRNSPAMAKHLAAVAAEAVVQVDIRSQPWISRARTNLTTPTGGAYKGKAKGTIRSGARIGSDGNVEGYVQVASPFWHIDEFGAEHTPALAPIRRGVRAALQARGGKMKEQNR